MMNDQEMVETGHCSAARGPNLGRAVGVEALYDAAQLLVTLLPFLRKKSGP